MLLENMLEKYFNALHPFRFISYVKERDSSLDLTAKFEITLD